MPHQNRVKKTIFLKREKKKNVQKLYQNTKKDSLFKISWLGVQKNFLMLAEFDINLDNKGGWMIYIILFNLKLRNYVI